MHFHCRPRGTQPGPRSRRGQVNSRYHRQTTYGYHLAYTVAGQHQDKPKHHQENGHTPGHKVAGLSLIDNYALPIEGISVKQNSDIERAATVEIAYPQVRRTNAGCRYGGCRLRQGSYYRSCQNSQSARGYPSECGYTVAAKGRKYPATITPTDTRINIPHARASV